MMPSVYEIVTDRIIAKLEAGIVPWRRPWSSEPAANLVSKRAYRGVNAFLLACSGYAAPFWLTFPQAKRLGGNVRKGERSTPVVFWKIWETTRTDPDTGETVPAGVPLLRYYNVFNVEQCDGIDWPAAEKLQFIQPIDACEQIVARMPQPPTIEHSGDRACYSPSLDRVNMPPMPKFDSSAGYYATLFHELGHSTGHKSRLNRDEIQKMAAFGDSSYSREELVAEMTAAFLCADAGIEPAIIDNAAAYIANWLKRLRDDAKLLVVAAARAQKAADWIQGRLQPSDDECCED